MKIILSFLITAIPVLILAQERVCLPEDETSLDPTLVTFVADMKKAIDTRDEKWIYSVLDKHVVSSYGEEEGIETFKMYWSPDNDSTDFWPYLTRVIHMGGVYLRDDNDQSGRYQFVFPYVYDMELDLEDDYFMMGVITGKNVNLRTAPRKDAEVVTQLTYNVVHFIPLEEEELTKMNNSPQGDPDWYHVMTLDKKYRGWVYWQYVYDLHGPRLFLFKDNVGKWMISAFVAGD